MPAIVRVLCLIALCSASTLPALAADEAQQRTPEQAATAVMHAFLEAFNARDEEAWAQTLHFPHVRLASQTVSVYPDRAAFLAAMDLDTFAESTGWRYSTWDDLSVVMASPEKVHIKVTFSRFDAADRRMATYESLYVIEHVDNRWGIRARSSFAP